MTFLPIVDRELRVAARRRITYRIRTWAAIIALVVGFFAFFPAVLAGAYGSTGKSLYTALTNSVFGLCLLAGVLFTADCLSEEKRESTLGLLFLTDLRGYDVVLGKFMAMSLNAFYGLLAILPITGLSLLLGGLTGGEFWRTTLALVNVLFVSLAAGICVSAFGRESQRVMGATLGLVILLAAGPSLAALIGRALRLPLQWECWAWISPYQAFSNALEPDYLRQPGMFWRALAVSHGVGWLLLALASTVLPHRWEERAAAGGAGGLLRRWAQPTRSGIGARAKARQELLPVNPVLWLLSSGPDLRRLAWIIVCAWGVVVLATTLFAPNEGGVFALGMYGVRPFGFLLKWLLALQACRFFVEARRNGTLETLLCTPVTSRDIIRGQVLALRRDFQRPVIIFLVLLFVPAVVRLLAVGSSGSSELGMAALGLGLGGIYSLRMLADCYALGAFGMWLALTVKKPGLAPGFTILFVLLLPSALCWLDIFADIVFILWGVTKLKQSDLRSLLAQQYQPVTDDIRPRSQPPSPPEAA
ncbi:MAG TPA: ABC transporter permease subunit [Candidatus Paceibacterota bacterium]|nr:ABC transporter permease subunit [Verrucomicrobiota bacterium]HSA12902.1 ABC transporter permease subunit [Candidatus Paceibacterota bacterium]